MEIYNGRKETSIDWDIMENSSTNVGRDHSTYIIMQAFRQRVETVHSTLVATTSLFLVLGDLVLN